MVTIVLVAFWVVVLALVAFFVAREIRAKRPQPGDFDRTQHEAVRMSQTRASTQGPQNTSQIGFGG